MMSKTDELSTVIIFVLHSLFRGGVVARRRGCLLPRKNGVILAVQEPLLKEDPSEMHTKITIYKKKNFLHSSNRAMEKGRRRKVRAWG